MMTSVLLTLWLLIPDPPASPLSPADRERIEAEARSQSAEADRLYKTGSYAEALPLYEAERASRKLLGDARFEAYAVRGMGCCLYAMGSDDEAVANWKEAIKLDAARSDKGFEGYDHLLIAQSLLRRNRIAPGISALEKAIPLLSTGVDRDHEADAQLLLAATLIKIGRADDAGPHLDRAMSLAKSLDDAPRLASARLFSGIRDSALGDSESALKRLTEASQAFNKLGDAANTARADFERAGALADLDRLEDAIKTLEHAIKTHRLLQADLGLANDFFLQAAILADTGKLDAAIGSSKQVVELRKRLGDRETFVESLVALANYQGQANDWNASALTLAEALKALKRGPTSERRVRLMVLAAEVERKAGHATRSNQWLDDARIEAKTLENEAIKTFVSRARAAAGLSP